MSLALAQVEHGPAQIFQTPFRAGVERAGADLVETATIVAPWGTERLANRPLSPNELGNFKHRIVGLSEAGPSVSPRVYSLAALETSIVVDDSDHYLRKLIHAYGERLPEAATTLATAVRGLPPALWWTYFTGGLDTWELVPAGYKLTFRTQDRPLRAPHPQRQITAADRPNAPAESIGRYYQIVYGVHDSESTDAKGMIEAIEVDSVSHEWHASLGRLGSIFNVRADGIAVPSSDYAVTYPLTNGFRETVIDFTASQSGKRITFDCEGLTDRGGGGGRVLTRFGEITPHWLANWVYGEPWTDGAWKLPSTAPADLPSIWWTDQFLAREGHAMTLVVGGDEADAHTDALTVLEGIARTFHIHPYWTELGKIAFYPIDPYVAELLLERPWIRARYHDLDAGFSLPQNTRQKVNKVKVSWLPQASEGRFAQTVEVEDLAVVEQAPVSIELPNSAAEA